MRFNKADNDDIVEKKKFLSHVHLSYLEKRIQVLD